MSSRFDYFSPRKMKNISRSNFCCEDKQTSSRIIRNFLKTKKSLWDIDKYLQEICNISPRYICFLEYLFLSWRLFGNFLRSATCLGDICRISPRSLKNSPRSFLVLSCTSFLQDFSIISPRYYRTSPRHLFVFKISRECFE